jgi:hypothetical protein
MLRGSMNGICVDAEDCILRFGRLFANLLGNLEGNVGEPSIKLPNFKIDLSDASLFGNDAADLEQEELFFSYALERTELAAFIDPNHSIQVIRAYKGEGKSALLRLVRQRLVARDQVVISAIGPDHSPALDTIDSDVWTREWKKSLLRFVANDIGAQLGMAFTDDAISLVEEAESNGFKKRSLISAIVDRITSKELPLERKRIPATNYEQLVKRYLQGRPLIWIVVDDIDQNFANTEKWRVKLGTFFTACRQIVGVVPELRIRTAIRPNIWAIIKREFEALSHIEQYIHDLSWSSDQFRALLSARITGYFKRTQQWEPIASRLPREDFLRQQATVALAFDDPMPWGGGGRKRPPNVVLWTLTGHRPRWLVELCKVAGKSAASRAAKKINWDDIDAQLAKFGQRRIEDTVAEFRSQCPQIEELLGAFSRQPDLYSTDELLKTIHNRIIQAVNPTFVGLAGKASDLDVAHFLFQVGFLAGRRDYGEHDGYDHVLYREQPTLLRSRTNLDDGLRWEVNPVFREVLNLRPIADKRHTKSGRR